MKCLQTNNQAQRAQRTPEPELQILPFIEFWALCKLRMKQHITDLPWHYKHPPVFSEDRFLTKRRLIEEKNKFLPVKIIHLSFCLDQIAFAYWIFFFCFQAFLLPSKSVHGPCNEFWGAPGGEDRPISF